MQQEKTDRRLNQAVRVVFVAVYGVGLPLLVLVSRSEKYGPHGIDLEGSSGGAFEKTLDYLARQFPLPSLHASDSATVAAHVATASMQSATVNAFRHRSLVCVTTRGEHGKVLSGAEAASKCDEATSHVLSSF